MATTIRCVGGGLWYVSGEVAPGWSTRPCGWTVQPASAELVLADIDNQCPNCGGRVELPEDA